MTLEIDNGVVIFLDVLGVSKFKEASEFLDFICEMKKMKIRAEYVWSKWKDKFGNEKIILPDPKIIIFQDTIVVCFSDRVDKENTLHNFFAAQNWLMAAYIVAIEKRLFFRGAISHGEYIYNNSDGDVAVLGAPLVDAYMHEKKAEWIGVIQTESFQIQYMNALEKYASASSRSVKDVIQEYNRFYVEYEVPLKKDQKSKYYVVNWPTILKNVGTKEIAAIIMESFHLAEKEDKPKYENTLTFLKYCEDHQFFVR